MHDYDFSHFPEVEPAFVSAMRGFLVVLALSLHEMFEGIALGLATTERFIITMSALLVT